MNELHSRIMTKKNPIQFWKLITKMQFP